MNLFVRRNLAVAVGSLLLAAGNAAEAGSTSYSMYSIYSGSDDHLADLPVDDATALYSSNPSHPNYLPPNQWRDTSGAVVSSPNYGWSQGGGLPTTWWTQLDGNGDSASVTAEDFRLARIAGGFDPDLTQVDENGDTLFQPNSLVVGSRSYLDWGSSVDPDTRLPIPQTWGHGADYGLFTLHSAGDVTISVSGFTNRNELVGLGQLNLRPGFTLWKGWDSAGGTRHTNWDSNGAPASGLPGYGDNPFSPGRISMSILGNDRGPDNLKALVPGTDYSGISTSGASELGNGVTAFNRNAGGTATLTLTNLVAGDYTIVMGGFCGREGNVATGTLQCSTGIRNQYKVSFSSVAPVPVPAAMWLFGSALAALGVMGQRKESSTKSIT